MQARALSPEEYKEAPPIYDQFAEYPLHKYSGLVKHLRRNFEAMRDEDKLIKREISGDDVDIDARVEAKRYGIHPFCITIDTHGREYLPHLYGPASYVVVDEVGKLPFKVANIYRRLTV